MESHAKRFVPTESNDFFFTVFSFCEKFFCGWTTIRKISMAYCYLIFNVEFFYFSKEQDMLNRDVIKKLPPDQSSSASVSPPPQQLPQQTESGTARRRKRTRALKDKTYMNDEGFMGT